MAKKKKQTRKLKPTRKSKPTRKVKSTGTKRTAAQKKSAQQRSSASAAKMVRRKKKVSKRKKPIYDKNPTARIAVFEPKGLGSEGAGQSGDTQGLAHFPDADSESVEELAEEGQAFEAEVISGVENAPNADEGEVTTSEVPADDVPPEYREQN